MGRAFELTARLASVSFCWSEDAGEARIEVQSTAGPDIDKLLAEVVRTPEAILTRLRAIVAGDAKK